MHTAVKEANVYGVQLPNHDGRAGCAALTLASGQRMDSTLARDLAAQNRKRLGPDCTGVALLCRKKCVEVGRTPNNTTGQANITSDPCRASGHVYRGRRGHLRSTSTSRVIRLHHYLSPPVWPPPQRCFFRGAESFQAAVLPCNSDRLGQTLGIEEISQGTNGMGRAKLGKKFG